jgi:bifunctional non-homologous end joining protein LigD
VITHPEKVLFPEDGITKGELAAYYEAIAPVLLPHIDGRPVTLELDPLVDEPKVLRDAALRVRDFLGELGLPSWVKTTGSKGFHIAVPLDGQAGYGEVARFAHAVGRLLVERDPRHLTQEFHKVDRAGRIFVDTGRNEYSATFAAAYAVRARRGAPVSAPCTWEELERGVALPQAFTLRTMAARVAAVGDPWADLWKQKWSLRGPLECLAGAEDGRER